MRTVAISDVTLREFVPAADSTLSFREKLEIAKTLGKLGVDVIELPPVRDRRADVLVGRTISSSVSGSIVSAAAGMTEQSVEDAWESVREAAKPSLHVMLPLSPIQMEYVCGKKASAVLELLVCLVSKCAALCPDTEFSALDATRAEPEFLCRAISEAIRAGAKKVTLCDSAGVKTPSEIPGFIESVRQGVPELTRVKLSFQCSDELRLGAACALAAVECGVDGIKTAVAKMGFPRLEHMVRLIDVNGARLGVRCNIGTAELGRSAKQLGLILKTERSETSPFDNGVGEVRESASVSLTKNDDISEVSKVVAQLGYSLSEEDILRTFEAVMRVAAKKQFVGTRELEAIIATTALQAPPAYRIESYTITSGNLTGAMANIVLEKNGKRVQGVSAGDGPIDAAFLAIEQVTGHHYELDEFQIQAVTEGREAMGSALIKVRAGGRLYPGSGISTDIIGAAIRAYVSALNKIAYEEG